MKGLANKGQKILVCIMFTLLLLSTMATFALEVPRESMPAMLEARTATQRLATFVKRKAMSEDDDDEFGSSVPTGESVTVGDRGSQITTDYAQGSYNTPGSTIAPAFPGIVKSKILKPVSPVEMIHALQAAEPVFAIIMPGIAESRSSHGLATDDSYVEPDSTGSQENQIGILQNGSKEELEEDVVVIIYLWYMSSTLYVFFSLINAAIPSPTAKKYVGFFRKEVALIMLGGLLRCWGTSAYNSITSFIFSILWEVLSK